MQKPSSCQNRLSTRAGNDEAFWDLYLCLDAIGQLASKHTLGRNPDRDHESAHVEQPSHATGQAFCLARFLGHGLFDGFAADDAAIGVQDENDIFSIVDQFLGCFPDVFRIGVHVYIGGAAAGRLLRTFAFVCCLCEESSDGDIVFWTFGPAMDEEDGRFGRHV